MKSILLALFLLSACATQTPKVEAPAVASATPAVEFTRSFALTFCRRKNKCDKPVTAGQETVSLKMEPFHKGEASGLSGVDLNSVTEKQVPFKSEIRVTKKTGRDDFEVYMMLRSGVGTAREGKVKTFTVKTLSELANVTVDDDPVTVKGGTLRAQLIVNGKP